MPRAPRILPETGVFHVFTRGNNKQDVFHDDEDFRTYIGLLKEYKSRSPFYLYHFVLMTNHPHLVIETKEGSNLSKIMQGINLSYVYHYRRKYGHVGHFWQGRFKSLLIQKDSYLLECGKYIELNPVRAKLAEKPEDYKWSSYRVYAYGEDNPLVDVNPLYETLGKTREERQMSYREFVVGEENNILKGLFYGSDKFIDEMERKYGVKRFHTKRGRPKKT